MSEQALGGIPLGFVIVVGDKPSELCILLRTESCALVYSSNVTMVTASNTSKSILVHIMCSQSMQNKATIVESTKGQLGLGGNSVWHVRLKGRVAVYYGFIGTYLTIT